MEFSSENEGEGVEGVEGVKFTLPHRIVFARGFIFKAHKGCSYLQVNNTHYTSNSLYSQLISLNVGNGFGSEDIPCTIAWPLPLNSYQTTIPCFQQPKRVSQIVRFRMEMCKLKNFIDQFSLHLFS